LVEIDELIADFWAATEFRGETLAALLGRVVEAGGVTGLGDTVGTEGFGIGAVGRAAGGRTAGGRTAPRYWALAVGVMNNDRPRAKARDITIFICELLGTIQNKQLSEP
jgi:hypothetical protein